MTAALRLLTKATVTKGRILGLGLIGSIMCLFGFLIRIESPTPSESAFGLIDTFALAVLCPVVAAVLASASLGDPSEDGTLVYLWLRPVAKWRLAAAGLVASLAAAVPLATGTTVLASSFTGTGGKLVVAALAASALAVAAYSGIFLALGLKVRRALAWGMAYIVVWEGIIGRVGTPAARLSVAVYARSILARWTGEELPQHAASTPVAILALVGITLAGVGMATVLLKRSDV